MSGHSIKLKNVGRRYGDFVAVDDVNIDVQPGEFIAFMGPSGCGKTTTLRLIAGLDQPTSGQIFINDVDVTLKKPWERDAPMVWQNFALFPHLNVFQNVSYGLERRKTPKAEIERRVSEALELVSIGDLRNRGIDELSGGQKQRVGIARALVLEPKVLLLDEPLSALDANLRGKLQTELKQLHKRFNVTFVYVTHYQNEALSLADRVVVMDNGRVSQIGTPEEIYRSPRNHFVAKFVGMNNIFEGRITEADGNDCRIEMAGGSFLVAGKAQGSKGDAASFLVSADRMDVGLKAKKADNTIPGIVRGVEYTGANVLVVVETTDQREIRIVRPERELSRNDLRIGEEVFVQWRAADAYLFPKDAV